MLNVDFKVENICIGQTDRQTNKLTNRQTDRQTEVMYNSSMFENTCIDRQTDSLGQTRM